MGVRRFGISCGGGPEEGQGRVRERVKSGGQTEAGQVGRRAQGRLSGAALGFKAFRGATRGRWFAGGLPERHPEWSRSVPKRLRFDRRWLALAPGWWREVPFAYGGPEAIRAIKGHSRAAQPGNGHPSGVGEARYRP